MTEQITTAPGEPGKAPDASQQPPSASANYLQVRQRLTDCGHAPEDWDSLAHSLALLPSLRALDLVLSRFQEILDTPVFQSLEWAQGTWVKYVPAWKRLLADWVDVSAKIAADFKSPSENWLDPPARLNDRGRPRNPLRRHGIGVSPLGSLLVTRHEFWGHPSADRRAIASRFDHLQAMLTAACIQLRWSSGRTPQEYLDFRPSGYVEFAPFPVSAGPACLAARWLSEAPQASLLDQFPISTDPHEFLRAIKDWENHLTPPGRSASTADKTKSVIANRPQAYARALVNYFSHWPQVLDGEEQSPRKRATGAATASDRPEIIGIDGFIQIAKDSPPGNEPAADPEPAWLDDDVDGESLSGLAEGDIRPLELPLISPAEVNGALSRQKWRAMQAEMAATVLPWDLRYLAPADADRVASFALSALDSTGGNWTPHLQSARADALLTLMTLALGQEPNRLFSCRIALLSHETAGVEAGPKLPAGLLRSACTLHDALHKRIDSPVLLAARSTTPNVIGPKSPEQLDAEHVGWVLTGQHSEPDPLVAVAFLISSIRPRLNPARETQDNGLAPKGSPSARNLILPACEVGRRLLAEWLANRNRTPPEFLYHHSIDQDTDIERGSSNSLERRAEWGEPAFDLLHQETLTPTERVERLLQGLTPPPGHDHWPVRLLRSQLGSYIEATTGDRTLAWLVTRQTEAEGEARLYYTQHRLRRLVDAWGEGLQQAGLARLLGGKTSTHAAELAQEGTGSEPPGHVDSKDAWAATIGLWPWSDPTMEKWAVGAIFVPSLAEVQRLVKVLRESATAPINPDSRSSLKGHHRWLLLHTLVMQGLCTGFRAVRSPTSLMLALEQADRVREKAGLPTSDHNVFAGLADKETFYNQRARLVALSPLLIRQLRVLQQHQSTLVLRLNRASEWMSAPRRVRAMFRLGNDDEPAEVSVAWFERELADLGFPWPANFARAFLRTQLLERGCPAADLDALLGHRDAGGGAIGLHSSFDYPASKERLEKLLDDLHRDLGLQVCASGVAALARGNRDTEVLQAPMHAAGPSGRGRSFRARHQRPPIGLTSFWQEIHQRATDDDRQQVPVLHRLLRNWARQGNAFAELLCADDPLQSATQRMASVVNGWPADRASHDTSDPAACAPPASSEGAAATLCDLEVAAGVQDVAGRLKRLAENGTRARFHLAASWFRLLLRARLKLERAGIHTPGTPLVAILRAPSSPFTQTAVLGLPIADGWRQALQNWATEAFGQARARWAAPKDRRSAHARGIGEHGSPSQALPEAPSVFSAEGWATALVVSAALNGMLLDVTQLSMLLRRFCQPDSRDLPLSGPEQRAHLDFRVPASGSMDRQTHRWWFDPMTEMIWLHAPRMPRELRLGDLHPWLRRIALLAFPGSTKMPFEPQSFSDLVRCAEVWWLARASRAVVSSQTRQIDASSILTNRWGRLVGAQWLVAPQTAPKQGASAAPQSPQTDVSSCHPVAAEATVPEPRAKRQRTPPAPTDFESLALVAFMGDRPGERIANWEPWSADAELLADLGSAHPWVQVVAEHLLEVSGQPELLDVQVLREALPAGAGPVARTLVEFAHWLATPGAGGFTGPALVRSFTAVAQAVLLTTGDEADGSALDARRLAGVITTIDDLPMTHGATPGSIRQGILRLARFLNIQTGLLQLLDPEDRNEAGDELDYMQEHESHADARVLSHEEFGKTMEALENSLHSQISVGERALGLILLMLCFRTGLRPGEVYGLRLQDVTASHLYVLPYGSHGLKSRNARRRVPHELLLLPKEHERLHRFVQERLKLGAQPGHLLLAQRDNRAANRQSLDRRLHRILRSVTIDPQVRLYHARHSFGTWTDLALRSVDHPEVLRFFDHMPLTRAFLARGPELAIGLFGSAPAALGRSSYALARLVGHVGPAVTHMHYIHGDDLVRAAVVEREVRKVPKDDWMRMLDLGRSATYALFSGVEGFHALIRRARRLTGWHLAQVSLVDQELASRDPPAGSLLPAQAVTIAARPETVGDDAQPGPHTLKSPPAAEWISLTKIVDFTQRIAIGQRSARRMAELHGLPADQVESIFTRLKLHLPRAAQPGDRATNDARSGRVTLPSSAEASLLFARAESWMRALAATDPVGLARELEFLLGCYDRRDRDFHVKDSAALRRLTTLLAGMGVEAGRARLIVRTLSPNDPPARLPACATAASLGAFSSSRVKHIGVRSAAKAASYAKWIGVMPVTRSGEGCSNLFASAAALGLSQLDT